MSKAELKPNPSPETDEPESPSVPSVIDISGPVRDDPSEEEDGHRRTHSKEGHGDNDDDDGREEGEEVGMDTELTIHVDGGAEGEEETLPRASDATAADAKAHTDAGSTLYGSLAAAGEQVHDHPLSLDVHASPHRRRRRKGDEEEGGYEYDEDDDDEDEDEEDDLGLGGMGRGGRESPQRFVLTGGKVGGMQVQEFGSKPRCVARMLFSNTLGARADTKKTKCATTYCPLLGHVRTS